MRVATKELCESARPHVLIPTGLASRRGSSVHKLHNMLHALFIETGAWSRVEKLCQGILMLTTDRGAERLLQSTPATMKELEQLDFLPTLATQTPAEDVCEQQLETGETPGETQAHGCEHLETGEPNPSVDPPPPPAPHHGARPGPGATRREAFNFVASSAGGAAERCCHNGCMNEIYACCVACVTPLCHLHIGSFQGEDHRQSRCHEHRHVTLLRPCPCLACKSSRSSSSGPSLHQSKHGHGGPGPGHRQQQSDDTAHRQQQSDDAATVNS